MKAIRSILISLTGLFLCLSLPGQNASVSSAEKIISSIIKQTGSAPVPKTVDVIKAGDPQARVTGIVTTMFATMDVLKKAVEMNCNLIIAHEPLFYNHLDETKQFENDPVSFVASGPSYWTY